MGNLHRCVDCQSFVVDGRCPSCGGTKVRATKLGVVATLLGATAFSTTLMACYGSADDTDLPSPGTSSGTGSSTSSSSGGDGGR